MTEQLLQALRRRANHRGLVIIRERVLTEELHITEDVFRSALQALAEREAIEVLSPPPFLAVKLLKWSGRHEKTGESGPSAYSAIQQLSNTQQLNSSYRRTGAHWPVDPALLREILDTLGETDGKSFEKAVEL